MKTDCGTVRTIYLVQRWDGYEDTVIEAAFTDKAEALRHIEMIRKHIELIRSPEYEYGVDTVNLYSFDS